MQRLADGGGHVAGVVAEGQCDGGLMHDLVPAPRAALLLAHTLPLLANGMTYAALRWAFDKVSGVGF